MMYYCTRRLRSQFFRHVSPSTRWMKASAGERHERDHDEPSFAQTFSEIDLDEADPCLSEQSPGWCRKSVSELGCRKDRFEPRPLPRCICCRERTTRHIPSLPFPSPFQDESLGVPANQLAISLGSDSIRPSILDSHDPWLAHHTQRRARARPFDSRQGTDS